ncbi:beta-glucosidase [Saprolegnia diclina VS20]|uniref:beta-glucosidase n=1 Tax=Saprolegnia diclina (strain VS20) TaxID=1156394 RepID=T0R651_SAPDV|nr:beta-glucosidase [Saprolegnia diclina VS20]EQC24957.1 beta-glucosidase [Saprolegnia diclina VS20]|eukprot:XP_008621621.1 beta-glucosidase [Saprolegnia diclina VS20]
MPTLQFPIGFVWGAATAAYQVEGAADEGGRGLSIWDAFSKTPGKTLNGDTGDKAVDHYHLYKEDVQLMANMGLKHYRFSISWPRILPTGRTDHINEEGIAFYNNLIDELLAHGITPIVTLYHWDLPLALQTEFDGLLGGQPVIDAFTAYARLCFERFGDRVKQWITINEPWVISLLGFGIGVLAPGRKHNGKTEPYIAGHNLLLWHAHAVNVYRTEFQETQNGQIGMTFNCDWRAPKPTENPVEQAQNADAAERAVLFDLGWFADPIYFGDYPEVMKTRLGDRLPRFTPEESALLKGSNDFFGLNHYSTAYVEPSDAFLANEVCGSDGIIFDDAGVKMSADDAWPRTDVGWNVVPWGFRKLLVWIQARYAPAGGIIVTENGCAVADDDQAAAANDVFRVNYYRGYIAEMHKAITECNVDVRGYYAWSFIDNYEWACGYSKRFGLHWVNYETMKRMPKASAHVYGAILRANALVVEDKDEKAFDATPPAAAH